MKLKDRVMPCFIFIYILRKTKQNVRVNDFYHCVHHSSPLTPPTIMRHVFDWVSQIVIDSSPS